MRTRLRAITARLLRTAIQHRLVRLVTVDKFYRIVGPRGERDVAHQRSTGEFAFDMSRDAAAILLLIKYGANPDIGDDFLPVKSSP